MIRILNFLLKHLIKLLARFRGFLDPFDLLDRLSRFGKPTEVMAPTELLRHGAIMHARGLLNSQAIQHNLDWVWPYWVERQFDPGDPSFVPRSFSLTHINLTHRDWTTVTLPDEDVYPIVDPRGLVTPHHDGWSLDGWVFGEDETLFPSQVTGADQSLSLEGNLDLETVTQHEGMRLRETVRMVSKEGKLQCEVVFNVKSSRPARLGVAVRPYNPEGIHLVNNISAEGHEWLIDKTDQIRFSEPPDSIKTSTYEKGDVAHPKYGSAGGEGEVYCGVGMASAVAFYDVPKDGAREIVVSIPYDRSPAVEGSGSFRWEETRQTWSSLEIPDETFQFLYDSARHTLCMLTPDDAYPGPFTYRRFWYRDAVMILHALLCGGMTERARRLVERFPERQQKNGYFCSQQGEWDSNGQVLWGIQRFREMTGISPGDELLSSVESGAEWILSKRTSPDSDEPGSGLLPAGFSAEHFGPNDFYYWDDFWAVAGLRASSELLTGHGDAGEPRRFQAEANDLMATVEQRIEESLRQREDAVISASPSRRPDAGTIGTLVAGYPLELWGPRDDRLLDTADYLVNNHFYNGGFFQDMMHSGINPYLTLHIAQIYLRAGDNRAFDLVSSVADLASSTGQWPEAVHPRTGGGCMGDGQHGWAAAEWILMIRNMIVREERETLVIGGGIPPGWLSSPDPISIDSAPTRFGHVSISIEGDTVDDTTVNWTSEWRKPPDHVRVDCPPFNGETFAPDDSPVQPEVANAP